MCEATTIIAVAGLAIAAAGTGVSLYAQSEQADSESDYQKRLAEARNKQIEENYQLAAESARQQYSAIQNRMVEEGEAVSLEEQRAQRERAEAVGTVRAASAETGAGLSVNALLNDFFAQEARYRDSLRTNLGYTRDQLSNEMAGISLQAKGRASSIPSFIASPVNQPNYAAAGLKIGGDTLGTYDKYRYKGPSTTTTPKSTKYDDNL